MNEDKSERYHRRKRRAGVLSLAWNAALLAGLVLTGASGALRDALAFVVASAGIPRSAAPSAVVAGYVAVLVLVNEAVLLPLSAYSGFYLERRFNLSTERLRGWLWQHVKGIAVGLPMAMGAAVVAYAAIARMPELWWAVTAGIFFLVMVGLGAVGPVLLLPLFYRFTPLEREGLRARLVGLAERAGVRAIGVYTWHLGERTRKANAALTGLGRTRRILLSDTLLSNYSDEEIEVILAHEIGHDRHRDLWKGVVVEGVLVLAGLAAADRALRALAGPLGLSGLDDVAGLPVLAAASAAVSLAAVPLLNAYSRFHERRADRTSLELTRNAPAFISAMRRLGTQNLAEESPSRLAKILFHRHPPMSERIAAARRWGKEA